MGNGWRERHKGSQKLKPWTDWRRNSDKHDNQRSRRHEEDDRVADICVNVHTVGVGVGRSDNSEGMENSESQLGVERRRVRI